MVRGSTESVIEFADDVSGIRKRIVFNAPVEFPIPSMSNPMPYIQ